MDPFSSFQWTHTDEDANAALLATLNQYGTQDVSLWDTGLPPHLPPSLPFDWNFDQYGRPDTADLLSNTLFASSPDAPVSAGLLPATPPQPPPLTSPPPPQQQQPVASTSNAESSKNPSETTQPSQNPGKRKLKPHVRGSRACQGCRKARMRCTGDLPCDRCRRRGASCSFDQPIAATAVSAASPSPVSSSSISDTTRARKLNIRSLLSKDDILLMHTTFMNNLNPDLPVLQDDIHSPHFLSRTSPFLFCVISFVSCRLLNRPHLHQTLHQIIRKDAFSAMTEGRRRIETVQAYLILSYWAIGAKPDSQDLSWLYASFAFRLALDLNLHRDHEAARVWQFPGLTQTQAQANRERTWACCLFLDRMLSPQRGKPTNLPTTKRSTLTPSNALQWVVNQPEAICVAALAKLHDLFNTSLDILNESNGAEMQAEVDLFGNAGSRWFSETQALLLSSPWSKFSEDKIRQWQRLLTLHYTYTLLVAHQFALEDALNTRDPSIIRHYSLCQHLARHILNSFLEDDLANSRGDSYFVFVTYSCITLIRLSHQRFDVLRSAQDDLRLVIDTTARMHQLQPRFSAPSLFSNFVRCLLKRLAETYSSFVACSATSTSAPPFSDSTMLGCELCVTDLLSSSGFPESLIIPGFDLQRGRPPSDHVLESSLLIRCSGIEDTASVFDTFDVE